MTYEQFKFINLKKSRHLGVGQVILQNIVHAFSPPQLSALTIIQLLEIVMQIEEMPPVWTSHSLQILAKYV